MLAAYTVMKFEHEIPTVSHQFSHTIKIACLPLGRTGGLRTKGLVDKLVSTIAAVTLSISSSSEDFLQKE